MYQANTNTILRRRLLTHRPQPLWQKAMYRLSTYSSRPMRPIESFLCGCFAGLMFAALFILAIIS